MLRTIRLATIMAAVIVLSAPAALAFTPPRIADDAAIGQGPLERSLDPAQQRALSEAPAWRAFIARHGAWKADWNEITGTPHRAIGPAVRLASRIDDGPSADAAVRGFLAANAELFADPLVLETANVTRAGNVWYVRYRQTFGGIPLLFADWEFRLGTNGNLMMFGADAHRIPAGTRTTALIPAAVARAAAPQGMLLNPATDRVEGGSDLYILPVSRESGIDYRLVYDVRVHTVTPPGNWISLVDAENGEVLWRHNRVRYAVSGTATGLTHPTLPSDPLASRPFKNQTVTVGANTATTNALGGYTAPATGTVLVSSSLRGPFVDVNRNDGAADAGFSTSVANPATVDISWNAANSHDAERDGFYHTNLVHDHIKALDPGATSIDYVMPCVVNINATCNAYWDGTGINFFIAGDGCPNTATVPNVVYHEYGHGVNDKIYEQAGALGGMFNGALHEGMADVVAAFVQDDPIIGRGFFGPGTSIRTLDNTRRWPDDASGDGHITGLIIGGAFWDLREAIGLARAESLSHLAKYGTPDDGNDGIAMSEYFVETLVADDDDANLANGTPNAAAIVTAFNAHGIGTAFFIDISHAPLGDQTTTAPYAITANVTYSGSIGALAADSVRVHYSTDGGPFQTAAMPATANPGEFQGFIPGQQAAVVSYYVEAKDVLGGVRFDPPLAPGQLHRFLAGPAQTIVFLNFELGGSSGWTLGDPSDDATTGHWDYGLSIGTYIGTPAVQPDGDHSDPGFNSFFTGNAPAGSGPGVNDVDNGKTTLYSHVFDATVGGPIRPVIEYWKWYTNNRGAAPGLDTWLAQISNNGGASWVDVENTTISTNAWDRVLFFIDQFVTPTTTMQMRFIAEDIGEGSLVEACIDDWSLIDFPSLLSVAPVVAPRLMLARPTPNPFAGAARMRFSLPAAGETNLSVYDVTGRTVRTLARGTFAAGDHTIEWNGVDDSGRAMPNGIYFVRLRHAAGEVVRSLARMR